VPRRSPEIDAAVARACEEVGLRPTDRPLVRDLLGRPETAWPPCCGASCRPCTDDVAAAARRARALVEGARGKAARG